MYDKNSLLTNKVNCTSWYNLYEVGHIYLNFKISVESSEFCNTCIFQIKVHSVHMHVCIPPGSVLFNLLSGFVRVRCAICSLSYILLWLFWSKGTFLDYQKREIAQVSIFVAAVHLFTCCLFFFKQNAIKTFILSIFFLASCWNVKIVSVLNDWGGQTVSHIFL